MVLKAADDARVFKLDPGHADVVVQATREISPEDVELYLNLTTMPEVNSSLKQVLVRAPEGARVVRVDPPFVLVERVGPADSITNTLRKP
jgi:hypothetical protein